MIESKYGNMSNDLLCNYLSALIGRVYKCLPLKETNCMTLNTYLESLLREMIGNQAIIHELKNDELFLSLFGTLEHLIVEEDISIFKSDVFKGISIVKKLIDKYK